jgi:dolichol-phosphate mannosyltransferase
VSDQDTLPRKSGARRAALPLELSVVTPTFNERGNVAPLVEKLKAALAGVAWEVLFVDDDSPDGTAEAVKAIAEHDPRVRCIRRVGRRGLAGAVVEGALASAAPYVAVIDADLQHDETLLPAMLAALRAGEADVVIGSRYLDDKGLAQGLTPLRKAASGLATALGRRALGVSVTDPVSGFFMLRREVIDQTAARLEPTGFKILFDILASARTPLRVTELPYAFQARAAGQSKLDGRVALEYLGLVAARLTGDLVSPRFIFFALTGFSGVGVQMAVLWLLQGALFSARFTPALGVAAFTAMTSNYLINNAVTYRDRRLAGRRLLSGYMRFCLLCLVGLIGNVAVGSLLHGHGVPWALAGLAGAGCGAVWNYVSTFLGVW